MRTAIPASASRASTAASSLLSRSSSTPLFPRPCMWEPDAYGAGHAVSTVYRSAVQQQHLCIGEAFDDRLLRCIGPRSLRLDHSM